MNEKKAPDPPDKNRDALPSLRYENRVTSERLELSTR
jgi:hypothetical protein